MHWFSFFKKIRLKTTNWLCRKKIAARFIFRLGSYCTQPPLDQQPPESGLHYTPVTMAKSTKLILALQ